MTITGVCSRSARSKASAPERETLGGIGREQQHLLGIAVRGIGAGSMSDCCVRVGMPVDGPPRWMLNSTTGISAKYASPRNSLISEMPGPEVAVNERAPFQPPPMATPIAASSSSACTMP